ncbi:Phosphoribosylformylglycinamidine cyclo-ligase [bacterium HR40]|nr:Phosphoribosylformylglycinamidine cyclo-ligase [bacterium HR40]
MTQVPCPRDAYADAGVDIDRANALVRTFARLARTTARPGADAALGGFGGVFDLRPCGFRDPLLVASTDGVGTKLLLARAAGRLDGLGIDLVAMCVNDVVVQGAEPLFFLDYYATGRLVREEAERLVAGMARGCREAGCALLGGETAEMPGAYREGEFDLAGFAVGAVERERLLPRPVPAGARILGLASSGPHANGFSLIRKVLREAGLAPDDPAPFAPEASLAELLLEPTRIYVKSCLAAARHPGLWAFAHITGGGLVDNPPRVLPHGRLARIHCGSWPIPPLFRWLAEAARLELAQMLRIFNGGIGMIAFVDPAASGEIRAIFEAAGETVWEIGEVVDTQGPARVEFVEGGRP